MIYFASISALLAAGSGLAQDQSPERPKSTEVFRVPPYPSQTPWKEITHKKSDRMELVEWIPADQNEDSIRDILTEQSFYASKGQSPSAFVSGILKGAGQACERARVNGPKEQTENGYAVAYAQVYCTNQKGASKDVDIFIKAVAGTEALYVAQREFRRPAEPGATPGISTFSKDQIDEMKAKLEAQNVANKFLVEQVQLCPTTGGTGACVQTATATRTSALSPGSALTPPPSPTPATEQASNGRDFSGASFAAGKSTADQVRTALGKPSNEDHNADGRFVYQYKSSGGDTIYAYLFDNKGVLIRIRGYKLK